MPHTYPIAALAFVAATASLSGVAAAWVDPTPEPRTFLHIAAVTDAFQFRRLDGRVITRREFVQDLDIVWIGPPGSPWTGVFGGLYRFDLVRPPEPRGPLRAEPQLEPTLRAAFIEFCPDDTLRVRFGRHMLASPQGLALLDGLSLRAAPSEVAWVRLAAGLRPESAVWGPNDWTWEVDGDLAFRRTLDHSAVLVEAGAGVETHALALQTGVRTERSADGTVRYTRSLDAGARIGREDGPRLSALARASLLRGTADRFDALAVVPAGRLGALGVGASLARPVFPIDSPFSVYPATAHLDLFVTGDLRTAGGGAWSARVFSRSWTRDGRTPPILASADRTRLGLELGASGAPAGSRFAQSTRAEVDADGVSWRATGSSAMSVRTHHAGPDLRFGASLLGYHEPDYPERPDGVGSFTTIGLGATLGWWARLEVSAAIGWDTLNRASVRTMALLDVGVPGRWGGGRPWSAGSTGD